ncbi:hypothetical protein H5410_044153 [Solanum commersonii]|uniref:Uncharacterized protein n=1 Tax=Solanum commersonii TaxID=4109 RepID=A0A9J5X7M3_SOLCO|nr:hypothetical protein H5410_044153 [Solanum commersonii]
MDCEFFSLNNNVAISNGGSSDPKYYPFVLQSDSNSVLKNVSECRLINRGSLARISMPYNLDDNTEAHLKRGEALNTF